MEHKAIQCGSYVHYLGWINAEQKDKYLKECNVFVLPTYFEGLPMSLLEGMAYECACVASEVGGIPQVMTSGKDGILVPAKEVESLKEALKKILEDPLLQRELGRNARKTVEEDYDINKSVQKLLQVYQSI